MSRYKFKKFKRLFISPEDFQVGDVVIGSSKQTAYLIKKVDFSFLHLHPYIECYHFIDRWKSESEKTEYEYIHSMSKCKCEVIRIIEK